MDLEGLVWLVLPMLVIVVVAVLMTKRSRAFTKKGITVGVIGAIIILSLYYYIKYYLVG